MLQRRTVLAQLATGTATLLVLGACASQQGGLGALGGKTNNPLDLIGAIRQLLTIVAARALGNLGKSGGFMNNALARIGIPSATAAPLMALLNQMGITKNIEKQFNTVAEVATTRLTPMLNSAISSLSPADANAIIKGGPTAATQFLKSTLSTQLLAQFKPLVTNALNENGGLGLVGQAMSLAQGFSGGGQAGASPFATGDVSGFISSKALDGIFSAMANEEQAVRNDPAGGGSALVAQVFHGG